jgi:hypothetical protein
MVVRRAATGLMNKYPLAEPEVLRLLAPQRGLTAFCKVKTLIFRMDDASLEGILRPIIKEVVERYLDCGNPRCGFARIRCPDCGEERLLMFSCKTRGFCPS